MNIYARLVAEQNTTKQCAYFKEYTAHRRIVSMCVNLPPYGEIFDFIDVCQPTSLQYNIRVCLYDPLGSAIDDVLLWQETLLR